MSLATIRAAVKTTLEGVSDIGNVYDYERWAKDWQTFLSLFKDANNVINGWMFSRIATPQRQATLGEKERAHIFALRGIRGLKDEDATEKMFQDHIEDIVSAFDADETLGGACLSINPDWGPMSGATGLQITEVNNRVFGTVLCHFAEGRLCALETISM